MKPLVVALVVIYLLMARCFLNTWLQFFKKDRSFYSNESLSFRVILFIATFLWPVVVPIAYLELLKQKNNDLDVV